MRSALYYPDTEVSSERLLKRALLMWDEMEYLVPSSEYETSYADKEFAEAMELIGRPHVPTEDEQWQAHSVIQDLVSRPLPESFLYRNAGKVVPLYEMYPQKLLDETWRLLQNAALAGQTLPNADYPVSEFTGLSLMAILADCCAGQTRCRVTDQAEAYAGLTSVFTSQPGLGEPVDAHERLIPITLKTIDLEEVSLKRLIEFRKREEAQGGHSIRDLRHRYVEKLEDVVKDATGQSPRDRTELERQFTEDMRDDLAALRSELRFEATQVLLSKEILVAALAGIAGVVSIFNPLTIVLSGAITASGAPVMVGGLIAARNKFVGVRRELLKKHPMSYLYELEGGLHW